MSKRPIQLRWPQCDFLSEGCETYNLGTMRPIDIVDRFRDLTFRRVGDTVFGMENRQTEYSVYFQPNYTQARTSKLSCYHFCMFLHRSGSRQSSLYVTNGRS